MKYPAEKLVTLSDKELATLARNAEERGVDDQLAACLDEIESRKKLKRKTKGSGRTVEGSVKAQANEILVTAQKAAIAKYPLLVSFNNPWGDSDDGLVEGRTKVSGSARHLPSLGPQSIAGVTRVANAVHVSLSYGKSKKERALVLLEAVSEKPGDDINLIVAIRRWEVDWPSQFSVVKTQTGFWETMSQDKYEVLGEYSLVDAKLATHQYMEAVDWMASLV